MTYTPPAYNQANADFVVSYTPPANTAANANFPNDALLPGADSWRPWILSI